MSPKPPHPNPIVDAPEDGEGGVHIRDEAVLSDQRYLLRSFTFDLQRRDGSWQRQKREVYDRGNGAAILLYNSETRRIILTQQFRLPACLNGTSDGLLLEAPAGLLDDRDPAEAIRHEVEEETGYRVEAPEEVLAAYTTPGAVTERLHFFIAQYDPAFRPSPGGGLAEEGEDIEVVEMDFDEALAKIASGAICDAKTILLIYHARINGLL